MKHIIEGGKKIICLLFYEEIKPKEQPAKDSEQPTEYDKSAFLGNFIRKSIASTYFEQKINHFIRNQLV